MLDKTLYAHDALHRWMDKNGKGYTWTIQPGEEWLRGGENEPANLAIVVEGPSFPGVPTSIVTATVPAAYAVKHPEHLRDTMLHRLWSGSAQELGAGYQPGR